MAVLNIIVALQLVPLSWMEDGWSIRPSSALLSFLLGTVVLDLAQARTLWLCNLSTPIAATFTASLLVKVVLLLLENRGKTTYLKQAHIHLPPESTSSIINRSFLWWMNGLYRKGFRSSLTLDSLYPLDDQLTSSTLSVKIQHVWAQRRRPERRVEFPIAAWKALRWHILASVIPRLFLIAFTFAQPFLISRVLELLTEPESPSARNTGYGLILVATFIYLGISLSTLYYNHTVYRFLTMFRGASVTLIFNHMLTIPIGEYDHSAVVTLMSTDVDSIVNCLTSLNEIWARVIEVALGIVLLARQLGWVCLVPVFVAVSEYALDR
jgi:ATP-binding cassette subfamily C (CFTR/MRP) protein 1